MKCYKNCKILLLNTYVIFENESYNSVTSLGPLGIHHDCQEIIADKCQKQKYKNILFLIPKITFMKLTDFRKVDVILLEEPPKI